MSNFLKRIVGAIVVLVVGVGLSIWGYRSYAENKKTEKHQVVPIDAKAAEAAKAEIAKAEAFKSNMESLNQKNLAKAARLALADDSEKSIRVWIEESFTSYDHVKVVIAGDKIDSITEINPYPIVRSYTKDPRVVVAENAKWWCGQYDSKAKNDRISRLEKMHHVNAIEAPPTAPKVEVDSCVKPTGSKNPFAPGEVFRNTHSKNEYDADRARQTRQQIKDLEYSIALDKNCLADPHAIGGKSADIRAAWRHTLEKKQETLSQLRRQQAR